MEDLLSYEGCRLVFEDNFDGAELDRSRWNVELHEPGWVNEELQEYVDSPESISVRGGKLLIRPVKTVHENGTISYTSGRITTQHKYDFTYGLFEARLKVPRGKGFLPAFWLMTTDEDRYGQWPECGEIDIMEIWEVIRGKTTGPSTTACPTGRARGRWPWKTAILPRNFTTSPCSGSRVCSDGMWTVGPSMRQGSGFPPGRTV